ncbi:MAG TPA: tetratricopeptide repeat protein [Phycisphaerae bacterium]|jgi:tetratricopeptide (TPR) repeat protein
MILSLIMAVGLSGCGLLKSQSSLDLYLQGQMEAQQGNLPAALSTLSAAIKENPRLGVAYIARANILKQMGNYEGAASDLEQVTRMEPYNFTANFELGTIYQHLKRFAQAVAAFEKSVEIRPLDPVANMDLALAYMQLGEPIKGVYYAERSVQADPDSPTGNANLGAIYAQTEYHTAAINSFKRAIELDSHQSEVYANLAQEYIKLGNYEQARNVLETARALAPSPLVYDRLGAACYKLQDFAKSREAFNEALKMDGKYYSAFNGLGVVAMSQALTTTPSNIDLAKEAIGYWNKSLDINKDQPTIQNLVNQYAPHE